MVVQLHKTTGIERISKRNKPAQEANTAVNLFKNFNVSYPYKEFFLLMQRASLRVILALLEEEISTRTR